MTSDKPVVDSPAAQGEGVPENSVPPQTVPPQTVPPQTSIPITSDQTEEVHRVGVHGEEDRPWAEGWDYRPSVLPKWPVDLVGLDAPVGTLKFHSGGIVPDGVQPTRLFLDGETVVGFTAESKMRDGLKSFAEQIAEAELRRQTVQSEAMVNLGIGVAMMKTGALDHRYGGTSVTMSPEDLERFQTNYVVTQRIGDDGSFIITVTPRER